MRNLIMILTVTSLSMTTTVANAAAKERVLVAGATGGTGQHIVRKLLDQGYHVRAFVRDKNKAEALFGDRTELFIGDIRDRTEMEKAMQGIDYVFSAIGARTQDDADPNSGQFVDFQGTQHLVEAAKRQGVKQFIMVSTAGLSASVYKSGGEVRPILRWKEKAEEVLRASSIPYTIIRPGGLSDEAGGKSGIRVTQGTYARAMIPREDVAQVCVAALKRPSAHYKTFEIVSLPDSQPVVDWEEFYQALKRDRSL